MQYLRADTAFTLTIGQMVDATNAVTGETGVDLTKVDAAVYMKHDGTTFGAISAGEGFTLTHKQNGLYTLACTTTSVVDTEGRFFMSIIDESLMLHWSGEFMVDSQEHWDAKYGADGVHGFLGGC